MSLHYNTKPVALGWVVAEANALLLCDRQEARLLSIFPSIADVSPSHPNNTTAFPSPQSQGGHDDGSAARGAATPGREAGTFFFASSPSLPPSLPHTPTPTPLLLLPTPTPKASFEQALRSQAKKAQRHTYTLFLRRPCLCLFFLLLLLVPFLNGLLLVAFGGCYHRNVFFFLAR
jgi:hypothetical protein